MSLDLETVPETAVQGDLLEAAASPLTLSLQDFVSEFGDELLDSLNRANPPVYTGQVLQHRQRILAALKSRLFPPPAAVEHDHAPVRDRVLRTVRIPGGADH